MASLTAFDNASLIAALKAAQAGDVVLLKSGTYASLVLRDLAKTDVTIRSADPTKPAAFVDLTLKTSSGLIFQNVDFRASGAAAAGLYSVRDVAFEQVRVYGSLDGDPRNDKGGLSISDSAGVTISGSEFQQLYWGVSHGGVNGLTIRDSSFHDLRMDGVRGGGSSSVLIERNLFRDFYSVAGDHEDAIQFWTSNTTAAARDIVVRDNVVLRGTGVPMQGIFFGDEAGLPYENVRIEGNLVVGALWRGVSISSGKTVAVVDNTVVGAPDQKSYIYADRVNGLTLQGNGAMAYLLPSGFVRTADNTATTATTDGGKALIDAWLAENATLPLSEALIALGSGSGQGAVVAGTTGADALYGGAGDDFLQGLGGSDRLDGSAGGDRLEGGDGFDYAVYLSSKTGVTVSLQDGLHGGDAAGDSFVSIEGWLLSGANDVFVGRDGAADVARGDAGRDRLSGLGGADKLYGGAGDDTLSGGAGRDVLFGDAGNDVLGGGAEADVFEFRSGSGHDKITDFQDGLDMIRLVKIAGVAAFSDLTITAQADGTLVGWAGGSASVLLVGVAAGQVDAADFGFG